MRILNKIILIIITITLLIFVISCVSNINTEDKKNDSISKTPMVNDDITNDTMEGKDDDVRISEIDFGRGYGSEEFMEGYKYFAKDKKVVVSYDYQNGEVSTLELTNEEIQNFNEAINEIDFKSWDECYFKKEDDQDSDIMYDGNWMIIIYYSDGTQKSISGYGGVVPEEGQKFIEALKIIKLDVIWDWVY